MCDFLILKIRWVIKKNLIKYTITAIILLLHFKAYSSECVFQGAVHPVEKTEMVKEVYKKACHFFTNTFGTKLSPKIKLNSVRYITDWNLLDTDYKGVIDKTLCGFFEKSHRDSPINDVYLNLNCFYHESALFIQSDVVELSFLFHELIHFFIKSASAEYVLENKIKRNGIMEEALCLWSQNKYIEEVTNDDNIMSFVNGGYQPHPNPEDNFAFYAPAFFLQAGKKFIYGSIHFFDEDTKGKYNKLINNQYVMAPDPNSISR